MQGEAARRLPDHVRTRTACNLILFESLYLMDHLAGALSEDGHELHIELDLDELIRIGAPKG